MKKNIKKGIIKLYFKAPAKIQKAVIKKALQKKKNQFIDLLKT